jgi:hypothetical protein
MHDVWGSHFFEEEEVQSQDQQQQEGHGQCMLTRYWLTNHPYRQIQHGGIVVYAMQSHA